MLNREYFEANVKRQFAELSFMTSASFENWLIDRVYKAYSEYPLSERMILKKLHHLFSTVSQGRRIIAGSGSLPLDINVADIACLLHDVGRFDESINNVHLVHGKAFDHGDHGASLFEQFTFDDFSLCETNKTLIAEAIRSHSRQKYYGTNLYAKVVRDADKLDNMINLDFQIENAAAIAKNVGLTSGYPDKLLARQPIPQEALHSVADFLIYIAAWYYDVNFSATLRLLKEEHVAESIYTGLLKYGVTKSDASQIKHTILAVSL